MDSEEVKLLVSKITGRPVASIPNNHPEVWAVWSARIMISTVQVVRPARKSGENFVKALRESLTEEALFRH